MILAEFCCEDRSPSSGKAIDLQMPLAGDNNTNDSAHFVLRNYHDFAVLYSVGDESTGADRCRMIQGSKFCVERGVAQGAVPFLCEVLAL